MVHVVLGAGVTVVVEVVVIVVEVGLLEVVVVTPADRTGREAICLPCLGVPRVRGVT